MIDIDRKAAIELTAEHLERFADKQGKKVRKETARQIAAQHAARALLSSPDLTLQWSGAKDCPIGYSNVFEFIAGEYMSAAPHKAMQKAEAVAEYANDLRFGFISLRGWLLDLFNAPIYMVPRSVDNLLIEVITMNPDFVVNGAGDTAAAIAQRRDAKAVKGQVVAATRRSVASLGLAEARVQLSSVINDALGESLTYQPEPIGSPVTQPALEAPTQQ